MIHDIDSNIGFDNYTSCFQSLWDKKHLPSRVEWTVFQPSQPEPSERWWRFWCSIGTFFFGLEWPWLENSNLQIWYPKKMQSIFYQIPQGHRILVGPYNKKTQISQSPVPFRKKKYASPLCKKGSRSPFSVNHLWSKVGKNSANREPQGPSCGVYKPQRSRRSNSVHLHAEVCEASFCWNDMTGTSVSPICGMSMMCAFHILNVLEKVAYIFCIDHLLQYQSLSQWLVNLLPPTVPPTEEIWPLQSLIKPLFLRGEVSTLGWGGVGWPVT